MGAIARPWRARVLEVLDAGVEDLEEIYLRVTPWVPQGHAFRERERHNARYRNRHPRQNGEPSAPRPVIRSAAEIHRIGARQVIRKTLQNLVKDGYIVRTETGYVRRSHASVPSHDARADDVASVNGDGAHGEEAP